MDQPAYNIYTLNNTQNVWQPVATISDTATILLSPGTSIGRLMIKVVANIVELEVSGLMLDDNRKLLSVGRKGNKYDERIEFTFIGELRFRHGTIYYGLQHAEGSGRTRLLIFGTNQIHHGGAGTNPMTDKPVDETIKEVLEDLVKNYTKGINVETNQSVQNALNTGTYIVGI